MKPVFKSLLAAVTVAVAATGAQAQEAKSLKDLLDQVQQNRVSEAKLDKQREAEFQSARADKQALLRKAQNELKAEENISEVNNTEITTLVNNYKKSLYINGYKERLVKQQLDTIVTNKQLYNYYQINKNNFKTSEDLLQFEYIYFDKDFIDKDEIIKQFKSSEENDKEDLERHLLNFKSYRLQDSTWVTFDFLKKKIPALQTETNEKLLKISKFIQKEDSLGVYLVAVKNKLPKNATAPLLFVSSRIKQIILHKRKLELIREIEKTLINDAIQNKNFKEY